MNRPYGPRRAIALSALIFAALSSACGSKLTEEQLATANGALQAEAAGSNGTTSGGGTSGGGVSDGAASGASVGSGSSGGAATSGGAGAAGSSAGSAGGDTAGSGDAAGGGGTAAAGCPDPCAPIVFGSIGTASGALGAVTGPAVPAIRAWVSYINDNGGLGGHPVEVVIADVAGDPTRAVSTTRQLVEERGVDAMFYDFAFTELAPVMEYLASVNVPSIGSIGGDNSADHAAMYFNPLVGPDVGQSWAFINAYRSFSDASRMGSIYCREAAVCASLNQGFSRFLPYARDGITQELVYSVQASLVQPNFTAEVIGAQQNDVEVLLGLMDTASLARIAQAVGRQQGYTPLLAGTYNLNQDLILRYPELEGMVLTGRVAPWDSSPQLAFYRQAMDRYQPDGARGDLGAGVFVVGALLQKYAGSLPGDPGPADMLNLLYSIHGETLDGLLPGITFHPGDKSDVNQCVVPMQLRSGAFVAHDAAESFSVRAGVVTRRVNPDASTVTVRLFELIALGLWGSGILFVKRHPHPVYIGAYLGSSTLALFDWTFNTRWFFNVSYDDSFLPLWRIEGEVQPLALCMTYAFYFGCPLLLAVHRRDRIDRALGRWAWPAIFLVSSLVNPLFEIPLVRWLHLWTYNQRPAFELAGVAWSNTWYSGLLFTTCYATVRVVLRWSENGQTVPALHARELRWRDTAMGTAAIWCAFYVSMQVQLIWYAIARPWADSGRPF